MMRQSYGGLMACVLVGGLLSNQPSGWRKTAFGKRKAQISNPIQEMGTLDQLETSVPFPLKVPTRVEGYTRSSLSVIGERVAQILYTSESDTLIYRMAEGTGDISGNYTPYPVTSQGSVEGFEGDIFLKGTPEAIFVATWTDGTNTYALTSQVGIPKEEMLEIIASVK